MATSMELRYAVEFGKGDGSDSLDWEIDLTTEEEKIYLKAVEDKVPLNEVEGLEDALRRARKEIEEAETSNACDIGDDYALECEGLCEIDPDKLNDLVRSKDPYALKYLELTELSDEELEKWDASELDELPQVCEIIENFEERNPFEEGWNLFLEIVDPNEDEDYDEDDDEE